jgi:trk system potassium uptake protein TrkA
VSVIDQDTDAFRKLRSGFKGRKITGYGFDRDVLIEAGIEQADAFAAVSSGDNSNIISARVVRESFGIQRVAARIYDPRRAEVYQRLGIPTVATVRWIAYSDQWLGEKVKSLEHATGARVAFIARLGQAVLPDPGTVLQEGDLVHVIAEEGDIERITAVFARRLEGGH